jgi:hypothetical protein
MSNLYGYSDYNGPQQQEFSSRDSGEQQVTDEDDATRTTTTTTTTMIAAAVQTATLEDDNDDDDDVDDETEEEDNNPLQVGFWMEGDSLAPPCGTSIATIHQILDFGNVAPDDVLYDLGCGDGRICLEAYASTRHSCRTTIGIEVEEDLVQRAQELIARFPVPPPPTFSSSSSSSSMTTNSQAKGREQEQSEQDRHHLPRVIQADLRTVLDTLIETARQQNRCAIGGGEPNTNNNTRSSSSSSTIDDYHDMQQQQQPPLPLPTVIILYLLPEALAELAPRFQDLLLACSSLPSSSAPAITTTTSTTTTRKRRPLRIVCNTWGFPRNWRPVLQKEIKTEESTAGGDGGNKNIVTTSLFLYTSESLPAFSDIADIL